MISLKSSYSPTDLIQKQIFAAVVLGHLFLMIAVVWNLQERPFVPPKSTPLKVQTVILAKPKPKPKSREQPKPKPKPKHVPKKEVKKEVAEKVVEKKTISKKQKEALSKLKQNIAKMEKTAHKSAKIVTVAVPTLSHEDLPAGDLIASILKQEVRLPEVGDVTFLLAVTKAGVVKKVTIESASSEKNRDYVKAKVPKIHFSGVTKEITLTITLSGS